MKEIMENFEIVGQKTSHIFSKRESLRLWEPKGLLKAFSPRLALAWTGASVSCEVLVIETLSSSPPTPTK